MNRLQDKTRVLQGMADRAEQTKMARRSFDTARSAKWFRPVVDALRGLAGTGELCMYCSANEPSQVEHYRPVTSSPERTFDYQNYLWTCDICNRTYKGSRFPPDTEPGEPILNPLDDNVWDFFFLDERFGRLVKRVDPVTGQPLPRAESTCAVVGVDRENLQLRRQSRLRDLRRLVSQTLSELQSGAIRVSEAREHLAEWRATPFQGDVADYFLNGPGAAKEPFRSLLDVLNARIDEADDGDPKS